MNKKWMMVIIGILIFWLVGCGKEDIENREAMEHAQADVTEVCAYIRAVEGDILVIATVLQATSTRRMICRMVIICIMRMKKLKM